jgi:non-ribosomal peptide synthetase component F
VSGEPAGLAPLSVQYADFALWQRRTLGGAKLAGEIEHWRRELAGAPHVLPLPTDRPRPAVASFRGADRRLELPAPLLAAARALSDEAGATLFMTLLAVFEVLLGRFCGLSDFLVGTPVAGRSRRELEGVIGCFLNTLVLRARPEPALSFRQHLARVRAGALTAYAHPDLPFEKLVEGLGIERRLAHNPLFQVLFSLQNAPLEELALPGLTIGLSDVGTGGGAALFDLAVGFGEYGGTLYGGCQYSRDLFEESTIDALLAGFVRLLEAAVADPDRPLAELPRLPELEDRAAAPEPAAGAPPGRLSDRREKVEELRQALPDKKRAALDKLLRAKAAAVPAEPQAPEETQAELIPAGVPARDR